MSQNSSRPLSTFNPVLAVLWLVDVVVTVAGYLILTTSNATQAEFYTSQSADYGAYFTAQTGSGLGATLIGAGLLGIIVTLAAQVVTRAINRNRVAPAAAEHDVPTTGSTATVIEPTAAPTATEPATVKPATAAPAAPSAAPATPTDEAPGDEPHEGPKTAF